MTGSPTILEPMGHASFAGYRAAAAAAYATDNVASGRWPSEGALERALDDFDESLPRGLDTPDNHVFDVKDARSGAVVGVVWFAAVVKHGLRSAFVYDIEIKAEHRRRGHARAAFAALEDRVKAMGLSSIGLHVFGQNPGAQALYRSLGYAVTGVNMLKHLPRVTPVAPEELG